jgi:hypothetical protein
MDRLTGVHFPASAICRSDAPRLSFLWGFVKDDVYVPPLPITLNNLKDRIRNVITKTDQPLLQNVWQQVEYSLDVCRATNGERTELA